MPRTFTVDEIASVAGVRPETVRSWVAEGRLGVPRGARDCALPFEAAARAVDLAGPVATRRIAVVNPKGGVGKTTTVFNLAGAFADLGRRVLVVDLDGKADLTASFGFDPGALERTIADVLGADAVPAADVVLETGVEGVHLLPADVRLWRVEARAAAGTATEPVLGARLAEAAARHHVVLFDAPPSLSALVLDAVLASGDVLVPVEADAYSVRALSAVTGALGLLREHRRSSARCWVLPTRVDAAKTVVSDFLRAFDRSLGERLLAPIAVDPTLVKAPMTREPVTRSFPASRAAREHARLARFLALPDDERDAWARSPWRLAPLEDLPAAPRAAN